MIRPTNPPKVWRTRALGGALLVALLAAAPAPAQEATTKYEEKSQYGPIQRRLFDLTHELSLGWAYLPLDPYYKGYGAQVAYTIHFDHFWALELFRVGWSYNMDTKLKTKLIEQMPDISPAEFPAVIFFENTNLIFKFFYGKQSFLNRAVLHFEVFATAGGALLYRNPYPIWDSDQDNKKIDFGVNVGFGARFWFDPSWSIRVDLRDTIMLLTINSGAFPLKNSAMLGVSFAVNL